MSKPKNPEKAAIRSHFVESVSKMPSLSHWPDRDVEFDLEKSEVCSWILKQPFIRQWIFDKARMMGAIKFDLESQKWSGVKTIQKP